MEIVLANDGESDRRGIYSRTSYLDICVIIISFLICTGPHSLEYYIEYSSGPLDARDSETWVDRVWGCYFRREIGHEAFVHRRYDAILSYSITCCGRESAKSGSPVAVV